MCSFVGPRVTVLGRNQRVSGLVPTVMKMCLAERCSKVKPLPTPETGPREPLCAPLREPWAQGFLALRSPTSVQIHGHSDWKQIFIFMQMRFSRVCDASELL